MLCIFIWSRSQRGHFLLARCRLLGTDCFHEAQQGLWFIINFCSLGGKIHYCGQHVSGPPPASSQACGRRESVPCTFLQGFEMGLKPAHSLPSESCAPTPRLTFPCQFSLLPFRFWCPGRSLSHMLWRLRCKFGKGPREPVV